MTDLIKLAVLGDASLSHAAAAWPDVADRHPDYALTFFTAPGPEMADLVLKGGQLVCASDSLRAHLKTSSGGLEAVRPDAYDGFVVYGLEFGLERLLEIYRTHRPVSFEWREPLPELTPLSPAPDRMNAISERLFDRIVRTAMTDSLAVRLIAQIRTISDAPVWLLPAPGFSAAVLETGEWDGILGSDDHQRLAQRYKSCLRKACPAEVQLIEHPAGLLSFGLFAAPEYLSMDPNGVPDLRCPASDYGVQMLERTLKRADQVRHRAKGMAEAG